MPSVIEANGSLSTWVNSSEKRLVVIDFFATWCGPCRYMHPIFDQLSSTYPNVIFIRVDSDQNRQLAAEYAVSSLPTFVFVIRGNEVDRMMGADPSTLERKIQEYSSSTSSFQGTGMSLGGRGPRDAQSIREMRLKNLQNVKMHGTAMGSTVSKMLDRVKSDSDEEVVSESSNTEVDGPLCDNLLMMGFSSHVIDRVCIVFMEKNYFSLHINSPAQCSSALKECTSRDIGDLVAFITSLPEEEQASPVPTSAPAENHPPGVVCDENGCHFVNTTTTPVSPPQPAKSFEERREDMLRKIQEKTAAQQEKEKADAIQREKDRIERGKQMQATREEMEAQQRKRELERQRQEKIAEENEKKRQLELWRAEHGLPPLATEKKVEKTPAERAKLLAESIALQRVNNAGQTALRTLHLILTNTAKDDPKYRTLRKDNGALQKKVACVPGAIPLMMLAGFELDGDNYVMKNRDDALVDMVVQAILKCM